MRKIATIVMLLLLSIAYASTDSKPEVSEEFTEKSLEEYNTDAYQKGFKVGWKRGYCRDKISCLPPLPPLPPLPRYEDDNYQGGYDIGFSMGYKKGH